MLISKSGAFGSVFLVTDQAGIKSVVKEVKLPRDQKERDQAMAEVHILSEIRHLNIVK